MFSPLERLVDHMLPPPDTKTPTLSDLAVVQVHNDAAGVFAALGTPPLRGSEWIFRGQSSAAWSLEPTLERFARLLVERPAAIEDYTLTEFKRQALHFSTNIPEDYDNVEWLAFMRHHGAPTRLLDFSKSPYVAAFFATVDAKPGESVAVWAIDVLALKHYSAVIMSEEKMVARFREIGVRYLQNPGLPFSEAAVFKTITSGTGPFPSAVVPVEPFKRSERMMVQQGLFLCAISPFEAFHSSLKSILERATADCGRTDLLHKIVIAPDAQSHVLRELHRMNLNYVSLVPGLDGLAQSLATGCKIRATTVPNGHAPDYRFGMSF